MFGKYDIVYKSKIFTWTPDNEYCYNTKKYIYGGTGYDYSIKLVKHIDFCTPSFELYNCQHAYGFLTRGCPNKCAWCVVPQKEGNIQPYSDIQDFIGNYKSAILMDNNVLAHDHGIRQIEKISKLAIKIDFNQGLDARLIDDSIAKLLSKIKWLHSVRLACDTKQSMPHIKKSVDLLRKHGVTPKSYFCYVLVKDIFDALERVEFLRELKVDPFAQAYRGFYNYSEPTKEQKNFCRWVNHKAIFKSVKWEDYK